MLRIICYILSLYLKTMYFNRDLDKKRLSVFLRHLKKIYIFAFNVAFSY